MSAAASGVVPTLKGGEDPNEKKGISDIPPHVDSSSFSPRGAAKKLPLPKGLDGVKSNIIIIEYSYSALKVQRCAIVPSADLVGQKIPKQVFHEIEEKLFKIALEVLMVSPVVLVDFFRRDPKDNCTFLKDPKTDLVEFHTICLMKKENAIRIIDPTKSTFSDHLKSPLEALIKSMGRPETVESFPHKSKVFYQRQVIRPFGRRDDDSRDCIDIAIKIAFALLEKNKSGLDIGEIINGLSNQLAINELVGVANDGTCIRELQSSDFKVRAEILDKLKKVKDLTRLIIFSSKKELDRIFDMLDQLTAVVKKHAKTFDDLQENYLLDEFLAVSEIQDMIDSLRGNQLRRLPKLEISFGKNKNKDGKTADGSRLHLAVKEGNLESVINIIGSAEDKEKKKLFKSTDLFGQTALHWAVGDRQREIAVFMIECIDYSALALPDGYAGYTVLHWAARCGDSLSVKCIVDKAQESKKAAELAKIQDKHKQTALHHVADAGMEEAASVLLDKMDPKDVLIQDWKGSTALHNAVEKRQVNIVKKLLDLKNAFELAKIKDEKQVIALAYASEGTSDEDKSIVSLFVQKFGDDKVKELLASSKRPNEPRGQIGATGPSGPTGPAAPPKLFLPSFFGSSHGISGPIGPSDMLGANIAQLLGRDVNSEANEGEINPMPAVWSASTPPSHELLQRMRTTGMSGTQSGSASPGGVPNF